MSNEETVDDALDEDGLVIRTHASTVLVVLPAQGYGETTMRYARSALHNVHVGTRSVSTNEESLIQGELQDEFQVDAILDGSVSLEDYSGVIFCGGTGAGELAANQDVLRLAREASDQGKLLAAWGEATAVLAAAGVVRKKRVTGAPDQRKPLQDAGARYTGTQIQVDGNLVTAIDDAAGFRFGKALVRVVAI